MINSIIKLRRYKNVSLKPFCYIKPSLNSTYTGILILLIPQLVMLFLTKSYASLQVICLTVTASLCAEGIFDIITKNRNISISSSIIGGILTGMLLPGNYPLISVFLITFITLIFAKYAFGGYYNSWINPVVIVVCVCYLLNMSAFPKFLLSPEDLIAKNPSLVLIQNGTVPINKFDYQITSFLNKNIFHIFGISIPEGYVSLFWNCNSAIPAFRFNFITVVSSIILISLNMIDMLIPIIFVFVYGCLIRFVSPFFTGAALWQGDILLALLTSGTLFSTLFILQWYGTTPITIWGKIVYSIISGILAFLIIGTGTSSAGYVFMVLLMNIITPLIETIESKQVKGRIKNVLISRINAIQGGENV